MISDKLATLAQGTALNTGGAASYTIGDVVDLGSAYAFNDIDDLYLVITVDVTATSGGSATASFSLLTDDNASMSSPTAVVTTAAIPVATLVAGYRVGAIAIPKAAGFERYIGLRQTTAVAAFTAGAVNAFLTTDVQTWRAYTDGISSMA